MAQSSDQKLDYADLTFLIVDDHDAMRGSLCDKIKNSFSNCVCLQAGSAEQALSLIGTRTADIVLMDIELPKMNGIAAVRRIKAVAPGTEVVVISIHDSTQYRNEAAAAGADGFVSKRNMRAELVPLLTQLASGLADAKTHRNDPPTGPKR